MTETGGKARHRHAPFTYTGPVQEAAERQRRLVRAVLAARLTAVVLLAMSAPGVLRLITALSTNAEVRGVLSDGEFSITDRVLLLFNLIGWRLVIDGLSRYGWAVAASLLGAYLWWHRPDRIFRSRGAPT